jgi:hypothetical protein
MERNHASYSTASVSYEERERDERMIKDHEGYLNQEFYQ